MSCVEEVGPGTAEKIQDFISEKVSESGSDGVVIGLSGGIDSSTVACLAVNALGPERVLGILMPSATTPPRTLNTPRSWQRNWVLKPRP